MKALFLKQVACAVGLGTAGLLATSCKEDILQIQPVANNTVDGFYQNEIQVNQGVIAIYNGTLSLPENSYWFLAEFRSDNVAADIATVQRDYSDVSNFNTTSQTQQLQATWTDLYEIVYRANVLQERIQPFSFARVPQFKGEARFLRALAYFDLVRFFGAVPIVDKTLTIEQSKQVPRAPVADVYKFIVDDLLFAADNLPATYTAADKGRATKWAAKALLAKVYLTMYGYPLRQATALPLAKQQLMDVYAAASPTTFSVATNFADLFKSANDNKYAVFEIQFQSGGTGLGNPIPWQQGQVFPTNWSPFTGFAADFTLPPALFGANWPKVDKRKAATLDSVVRNASGTIVAGRPEFTKFLEKGVAGVQNRTDYPNNFPIIRFEDVVLMYAEVLTEETGGTPPPLAISLVNQIRTRSGLTAFTATSPETASQAAFRAAILKERRYEFVAEGQRWHDLVRTGNAISVMTAFKRSTTAAGASFRQLDDHDLIFPIPLLELRINPGFWQQNPGYN
ncbi:RagB/SusD family nutrient uptake outer membrane protein [Hymenobacter convexus]|uniref:RagB/SusD family nutrient uptake outer membrane protein n=1 Tax=Hymenobacter sp. CA1UV-4 TaxID=3063782 RepID=UPI002712980F|nr:RagB/SusD family nutrient uptake outer membrane protein [Hymenobacter sp. CA1UV-4]MDO7851712.1 RagB/SusD family nutrient uptake outer membrane protein [Hymenobacter sp. CA1UV-4]